jgi:TPR repeat protein
MNYLADRRYRRFVFALTLVTFGVVLVIFAFSSCEVRKRSEKRACRNGDVEECLYVGRYYEAKADGIIGFAMSNADTAIANYYRACRLKSAVGCERMMYLMSHSDQAKNLSTELTDIADALIEACAARVDGGCLQLWDYMDGRDWVGNRSAIAFERMCNAGTGEACYRLGRMHGQNLGGQHNVLEEVVPIYEKGCANGSKDACNSAQEYRDVRVQRATEAQPGTGSDKKPSAGPRM